MKETERLLQGTGITPTPVRVLVYRCLSDSSLPLSLTEIEVALDSVDKSTISRTLSVFKERHLVHSFEDGSGSTKYEICNSSKDKVNELNHVHFRCVKCGVTECLNEVKIPSITLPDGYLQKEVNYVIKGICPACGK